MEMLQEMHKIPMHFIIDYNNVYNSKKTVAL